MIFKDGRDFFRELPRTNMEKEKIYIKSIVYMTGGKLKGFYFIFTVFDWEIFLFLCAFLVEANKIYGILFALY